MNHTVCLEDYSFGPQTSPQCRNGLDLTVVFEESMLSLLPASLMITASIARFAFLHKARKVVLGKSFYDTKSVSSENYHVQIEVIELTASIQLHLVAIVILRFVLLLLWSIHPPVRTQTSVAAASISLLESFALFALSKSEHVRSIRPSSLLNLYLLFSLGLDFIRMRTLVKMQFDTLIVSLSAANMAIKASLLLLEAQNKRAFFSAADADRPPQETSGIFNRSVFWWLNSLFLQGKMLCIVPEVFKSNENQDIVRSSHCKIFFISMKNCLQKRHSQILKENGSYCQMIPNTAWGKPSYYAYGVCFLLQLFPICL